MAAGEASVAGAMKQATRRRALTPRPETPPVPEALVLWPEVPLAPEALVLWPEVAMASAATPAPPLGAFLGAVQGLGGFLREEERAAERPSVQGRWYVHTPLLAEAGAAMLEAAPELFLGLDFAADDLLADKDRLLELQAARAAVDRLGEALDRAVLLRKDRLARRTGQLRDAVAAKQADPALPRPVRERLLVVSAPLRTILDGRRAARRAAIRRASVGKAAPPISESNPPR